METARRRASIRFRSGVSAFFFRQFVFIFFRRQSLNFLVSILIFPRSPQVVIQIVDDDGPLRNKLRTIEIRRATTELRRGNGGAPPSLAFYDDKNGEVCPREREKKTSDRERGGGGELFAFLLFIIIFSSRFSLSLSDLFLLPSPSLSLFVK